MVKIVNGVLIREPSQPGDQAEDGQEGVISICGYSMSKLSIGGLLLLAFLLNGVKGLVFCGSVLGMAYFFSNPATTLASSATSSAPNGPSFGGASRIRGVKDLPKAPAKC